MKQLIVTIVGIASMALLAACGAAGPATGQAAGAAAAPASQTSSAGSATELTDTYQNALPVVSQLILGSLRLEEGDQAIDAAEAGKLLPLWQAYQSLSNSDTTAPAELEALVRQIEGAMQPDQIVSIAAMQLTSDNIGETLQALGPGLFGGGFDRANAGGSGSSGGGFTGRGGDFPAGGPPPGDFGGGGPGGFPGGFGGAQQDPSARETAIAERLSQDGGQAATFMTRGLLNQLITSLQLKTGELTQADLDAQQAQRNVFRWLPVAAETTGIPVETLQEALAGGATLAEAIDAQGGDLAAVQAAVRDALKNNPNLDDQAIEAEITAVFDTKTDAQLAQ
ncbi:MAG: hypothetical protein R2844_16810 [Caldilineales bacterium]